MRLGWVFIAAIFPVIFCPNAGRAAPQVAKIDLNHQSRHNLLRNPGFEDGTLHWFPKGCALSVVPKPVFKGALCGWSSQRSATWSGPAQDILPILDEGESYFISAWVRLQGSQSDRVKLTVKQVDSATQYHFIDDATVSDSEWKHLGGMFTLEANGPLQELTFYAEGPAPGVDLLVDAAAIWTAGSWRIRSKARIERIRKRDVRVSVIDFSGVPVPNAAIDVDQTRRLFAFGTAVCDKLPSNADYRQFFLDNFEWAVFESESKWWYNEPVQGQVDYSDADAMMAVCEQAGIPVRGHCIFWAKESKVQDWVKALPDPELRAAVDGRLSSAVNHFAGRFVHWDVNNEMLHGSFYKDRLGEAVRIDMFQQAALIDPGALLFVNDYSVVTGSQADDYVEHVLALQQAGAPVQGVGAQCHFSATPEPWLIWHRLDKLAALDLPVWCTEFHVVDSDEIARADKLERFYRAAFSHPAVEGILMWGFWAGAHYMGPDAAIVNLDWTLNEAGRRYRELMEEWTTHESGTADSQGVYLFRGFHGEYTILLSGSGGANAWYDITLAPGIGPLELILTL